jgi:hypothetical protein
MKHIDQIATRHGFALATLASGNRVNGSGGDLRVAIDRSATKASQ